MENTVLLVLLALYGSLLVLDLVAPARALPKSRFWRLRGVASLVLYFVLAFSAPLLWDGWLGAHRLVDLTGLGTWGGAAVGYLVVSLGVYVYHRAVHASPLLFRWFHQMHHSAERVDIWGAYYFSPLDTLAFTFIGSFCLVFLVGLTPEATILASGLSLFFGYFQHANLRTPRWMGYVIQRPEQHALHHQRGVHAYNYGDLAFIDMLFGTWKNPDTFEEVSGDVDAGGFYDGASLRVGDMLLGRDVTASPAGDEAAPHRSSLNPAA